MPRIYGRCIIMLCQIVVILLLMFTYSSYRKQSENNPNVNLETPREYPAFSEQYITNVITKFNLEEKVRNIDVYESGNDNTVVIVVLVDKFSTEISNFLASLSQIRGIEEALIIFSHAYFDLNLNRIIENVDFCRVLQIFYPYSVQIHPRVFPGRDPNDCPSNINKNTAEAMNCTGASFPDFRGHYRDPKRAESKHHWWWTSNQVFERLRCTQKYTDSVIFLEDDFLFMTDFIYMALYMKNIAGSLPQCDLISMGTNSVLSVDDNIYSARLTIWDPKNHSSVLAFGVTTWNTIAAHYDLFCSVDDTSWFRSLHYISLNRKDGKRFTVLTSVTPRAYKIVSCHLNACDTVDNKIKQLERFEKENEANWFPPHVELYIDLEIDDGEDFVFDYRDSDGGWADPRDVSLCRNMTLSKIKKVLMEMDNSITDYNNIEY